MKFSLFLPPGTPNPENNDKFLIFTPRGPATENKEIVLIFTPPYKEHFLISTAHIRYNFGANRARRAGCKRSRLFALPLVGGGSPLPAWG